MSNIILYSDLNRTYQGEYDFLLKRIDDYVDAYAAIKQALIKNLKLVVVVQNRYCLSYLNGMVLQYGNQYIEVQENSPRRQLADILKTTIPEYISDEDIVDNQLIYQTDHLHYKRGMSFDDIILQNFMSMYFTYEKFPFSKIIELIKSIDYENYESIMKNKIVRKVFKVRLNEWIQACKAEYQKNIIKYFSKNPAKLLENICKHLIIRGYSKQLQLDVLGSLTSDLEKLKLKEKAFLIEDLNFLDVQRNIKIHLNQLSFKDLSKESIKKYVGMVSGVLFDEFEFILNVIENNISIIDEEIVKSVEEKFESILIIQPQYSEKIKNILPPQFPKEPAENFTVNDWLTWALNEYLPYKFWLENNDIYDDLLDKYSALYGDWIYNNYHQLLSSEPSMLYKSLINLNQNLCKNSVSLIVMVDNFNFKYVPLAKEFFGMYGFSTTIEKPLISMLPTETSVSKVAFFSGEPYASKNKSYKKRCQEWEIHYDKKIKYLSDISKLNEINKKNDDIYILNYISIDKILHESQSDSALPINYRIQEELKALVGKIISFSKRIGHENELKVYFVSDHGSTKIFPKQLNLIDSQYYKEKAEDSAHRYISLKDKQFETYKNSLGHLCYILDRNQYGMQENYLIAKNYYRFIKTDGSFYVHGGITPEENIIPLLKFEKTNANLIDPDLILRTNEFRYSTLSNIVFTLKNYNQFDFRNVEILITNRNVNIEKSRLKIGIVSKESEQIIEINGARIMKSKEEQNKLMIKLQYDFIGKKYHKEYSFEMNIKSIQENKIDLDDLF